MGLLDELLGGGGRRDEYSDFVSRYEQGRPDEGYDDDEVSSRYDHVAREVDEDTYREAARDSFGRMDPGDRAQLGGLFAEHGRANGVEPDYDGSDDPDSLARLTSSVHRQSPDLLSSLLGGGGGGGLGGSGMGGGLGSLAGALGGGGGGPGGSGMGGGLPGGGNPLARAALAGITAMAARRLMSR